MITQTVIWTAYTPTAKAHINLDSAFPHACNNDVDIVTGSFVRTRWGGGGGGGGEHGAQVRGSTPSTTQLRRPDIHGVEERAAGKELRSEL